MPVRTTGRTPLSDARAQSLLAPSRLALMVMWIVVTGATVVMLLQDVRSTDEYETVRFIMLAGYVGSLLFYLARSGPSANQLPKIHPQVLPRWRYGAWVPPLGIALMLTLIALSDDALGILTLPMIVATVWILLAWRREVRLRSVVQGLALALIAYLAGLHMANNDSISKTALYLLPVLTLPMYVAGGLLFERTRLGGIQLLAEQYGDALKSVLWGGVLFVPLGLINAADGAPGSDVTWVTE